MTPLRRAIEAFRDAQRERQQDVHDAQRAENLRRARAELDAEAAELLGRLPFRVRMVTEQGHLAVAEAVALREGKRAAGQTLCGAPSGRHPFGHPARCPECLLVAERYLVHGPPPLELELGL